MKNSPAPASKSGIALGLRERHKQDKLLRIKAAARSVFVSKGYDAATTREIAQLADVSQATVFLYAKDKRELLFLVFSEDMDQVVAEAVAAIRKAGPLVDRLVRWYTPFLRFFSADVPLGLLIVRERNIVSAGDPLTPQGLSVKNRDDIAERELMELVKTAVQAGEINGQVNPVLAVRVIRSVFFGELERWQGRSPHPSLAQGLRELRAALELVANGLRCDR